MGEGRIVRLEAAIIDVGRNAFRIAAAIGSVVVVAKELPLSLGPSPNATASPNTDFVGIVVLKARECSCKP